VSLIENICAELGHSEKSEDMVNKYVDSSIKFPKFKDSAAPKKPKTAYMCFCEKHRPAVKLSLGESADFASVVKKLASEWRNVLDKSEYEKMSELDKERYTSEFESYNSELFKSNTA